MKQQAKLWTRVLIVGLLLVVTSSVVVVSRVTLPLPAVEANMLEPGDIFFVDLYRGWAQPGYWDHMALYVGEQPYAGVVEATYNAGVCFTALPAFLQRDEPAQVSVRRLRQDVENREQIIEDAIAYAMTMVGLPFNFTATATFPMKINEENAHCAEVVWRAYRSAGVDLDGDRGLFLYPDDIYYSPKLEAAWT